MAASVFRHPGTQRTQRTQRTLEYLICFCVWSGACLYSAYKFHKKSHSLTDRYVEHFHVGPSWFSHLEQSDDLNQDDGDGEWTFWQDCIIPIVCLQTLRALVRYAVTGWIQWSALLLLVVDLSCCFYLIGPAGFVFHFLLTGIFFLVALAKSRFLTWTLALTVLLMIVFLRSLPLLQEVDWISDGQTFDRYLLEMTSCYLVIRSISFAFDYGDRVSVEEDESPAETFFCFLQYQFFLPLYFIGPHLDYSTFCRKTQTPRTLNRTLVLRLAGKIAMAVGLFEFFSHFLYPFSVRFDQEIIETMNLWSLAGVAYTLGQFFHLKYLALFGFFGFFSTLNGVDWAPLPICVSWVHRYSLMWQYFDHGLYVFLKGNIYKPLTKQAGMSRAVGSLGCYAFILLWHGLFHRHIFIWVGTNWISLLLEKFIYARISDERLRALANAPVMIASIVANMCFLGDSEFFPWQLLKRIFLENSLINVIGVFLIFYCGSFVGPVIEKWKYPPS